jgi:excisionase family DNA binding protein
MPRGELLTMGQAAKLLQVSPSTVRSWEHRHGFPHPHRTAGGHRRYDLEEVERTRDVMAVSRRERLRLPEVAQLLTTQTLNSNQTRPGGPGS